MRAIIGLVNGLIYLQSQFPHSLLSLGARILMALVFLKEGQAQFDGWFNVSDGSILLFMTEFSNVPIPPILAAQLVAYGELVFGIFLIVGFATRFSACGLLFMTAVIQLFVLPDAYILHGLWAVALLYIIKYGAGAISFDCLINLYFHPKNLPVKGKVIKQ